MEQYCISMARLVEDDYRDDAEAEELGRLCRAAHQTIFEDSTDLQTLLLKAHQPAQVGFFMHALHQTFGRSHMEPHKDGTLHIRQDWGSKVYEGSPYWLQISELGEPYFRGALSLMLKCWPFVDPEDEAYASASLAFRLTGMTLVELHRLSKPGGPVRCRRPKKNRRLIHLGDVAKYIQERDTES